MALPGPEGGSLYDTPTQGADQGTSEPARGPEAIGAGTRGSEVARRANPA